MDGWITYVEVREKMMRCHRICIQMRFDMNELNSLSVCISLHFHLSALLYFTCSVFSACTTGFPVFMMCVRDQCRDTIVLSVASCLNVLSVLCAHVFLCATESSCYSLVNPITKVLLL